MKKMLVVLLGINLLACNSVDNRSVGIEKTTDSAALESEAKDLVKRFAGQLKPALKNAIAEGGFPKAVQVCATQAPAIAAELSANNAWQIKRVSLKPRNQTSAIADQWERQVLATFEQALAADNLAALEFSEVINNKFRFMKAQKVQGLCLACHGNNISSEAQAALKNYYPDDKATGYSLGQIRGAFSLSKDLSI